MHTEFRSETHMKKNNASDQTAIRLKIDRQSRGPGLSCGLDSAGIIVAGVCGYVYELLCSKQAVQLSVSELNICVLELK